MITIIYAEKVTQSAAGFGKVKLEVLHRYLFLPRKTDQELTPKTTSLDGQCRSIHGRQLFPARINDACGFVFGFGIRLIGNRLAQKRMFPYIHKQALTKATNFVTVRKLLKDICEIESEISNQPAFFLS